MRDYGKVAATYWTGDTGRRLRKHGIETQLLGLYLLTCQNSTMSGLYYLPIPIIAHETGLSIPAVRKALARASEAQFASYDEASETVFVYEMPRFQLGETLTLKDKRHKGLLNALRPYRKNVFYQDFVSRHGSRYKLPRMPLEAPSEGLGRGEHDFGEEQEQEQEQKNTPLPPKGGIEWVRDPHAEAKEVCEAYHAKVTGAHGHRIDSGVRNLLMDGAKKADMLAAVANFGAWHNREQTPPDKRPGVTTFFSEIDWPKYIGGLPPPVRGKTQAPVDDMSDPAVRKRIAEEEAERIRRAVE